MTSPRDFIPIRLRHVDARYGRSVIREIQAAEKTRNVVIKRGRYTWAGPAAEAALCHAFNGCRDHGHRAWLPNTFRYDLALETPHGVLPCEVKTRVAERGWVHPERFDWISVPLHEDREPIKPDAQLIIFCWWSADAPRVLWVVGCLKGLDHFQRVATFYKQGMLLPRGGYVEGEGTYQVDVAGLLPVPRKLFKEMKL
jgi:hypothetical protein